MRVVEYFCRGKSSQSACEDRLVMTGNHLAVIDGVSSKYAGKIDGESTGEIGARLAAEAIGRLPAEAGREEILAGLTEAFAAFYRDHDFPGERRAQGPQAVCAIYSVHRRTLWLIGDAQMMIDGELITNPKPSDLILARMRALAAATQTENGVAREEALTFAREAILPWILRATCFANRETEDFGYAVVNGEPIPPSLVIERRLPPGAHEVVLASDGYPMLAPTLAESEAALRRCLRADPACLRLNPQTKGRLPGQESFDDRCYLRFMTE